MNPEHAIRIAERALAERFIGAEAAFVAGSMVRQQATASSDVDLIVLFPHLAQAHRESFTIDATPVEAFVHDDETLRWFVDSEIRNGRASLLGMMVEGQVIGHNKAAALQWQNEATAKLADGPPPLSKTRLEELRYSLTDMLDDLCDPRPGQEVMAIGTAIYGPLAELALRARGQWYGRSKWTPRMLDRADPDLSQQFGTAFAALFKRGDVAPLIAFTAGELDRVGGRLFDGYRREAAASLRTARAPKTSG